MVWSNPTLENSLESSCVLQYSRSEPLHRAAYLAWDRAVRRVWGGVLTAYGSEGWGFEFLRAREVTRSSCTAYAVQFFYACSFFCLASLPVSLGSPGHRRLELGVMHSSE
jgi:hypothetical protein